MVLAAAAYMVAGLDRPRARVAIGGLTAPGTTAVGHALAMCATRRVATEAAERSGR